MFPKKNLLHLQPCFLLFRFVLWNNLEVVSKNQLTVNMIRKLLLLSAFVVFYRMAGMADVSFEKVFCDSTLRLDYIAAGNSKESNVFLDRMHKFGGWAGRRCNLDSIPYVGNGIVTVADSLSGDTIYRHSFSTLFREWQSTPEAAVTSKSFQNTFLIPLPRRTARITIELLDARHDAVASNTHLYSPDDILVKESDTRGKSEYRYLRKNGNAEDVIDVAILADGYNASQTEAFYRDAEKAVTAILSHEPFKDRESCFNFVAVATVSEDEGVSVPRRKEWKKTSFGSNFDTFYSDRYLTTGNVSDIHESVSHVPYEHIIVLANCDVYGGGGIYNSYTLTTTGHNNFAPVVVHEFGHSFGGLADEYFYEGDVMEDSYPFDVEPWEPNITTLVDFDSKWKSLLEEGTPVPTQRSEWQRYPVGVFEGGGYSFRGVYSPADRCRMRDNEWHGFCPACRRALNSLIDFYVKE